MPKWNKGKVSNIDYWPRWNSLKLVKNLLPLSVLSAATTTPIYSLASAHASVSDQYRFTLTLLIPGSNNSKEAHSTQLQSVPTLAWTRRSFFNKFPSSMIIGYQIGYHRFELLSASSLRRTVETGANSNLFYLKYIPKVVVQNPLKGEWVIKIISIILGCCVSGYKPLGRHLEYFHIIIIFNPF